MRLPFSPRQQGAALVTVLFLMLAVLMMSVSSLRAALMAAKSTRVERDRHVALAAAEAALLDAERDIDGAAGAASPRAAIFAALDASAFMERCSGGAERTGLCRLAAPPGAPAWQAADLAGERAVEYGRFSGRSMPTGAGLLPARLPRYLIELLAVPGRAPGQAPRYRITAIGFGADAATVVVLQGYYIRASATAPGGRLGWREIANWPALHRAAS
ncbi:pilus assembly protein [Massilia niabensis]|uniref:Pilus assembly protein n=1 Tax=Massilia niabensis TaxID=544910 RepID=A0ABW0L394_9BURK